MAGTTLRMKLFLYFAVLVLIVLALMAGLSNSLLLFCGFTGIIAVLLSLRLSGLIARPMLEIKRAARDVMEEGRQGFPAA